jgi:acylphosphatase
MGLFFRVWRGNVNGPMPEQRLGGCGNMLHMARLPSSLASAVFTLVAIGALAGCSPPDQPEDRRPPATRPATTQADRPEQRTRRVHAFISGRVQGVGFRAFTEEQARQRSLTGYVRNLPDGRVEAVIEGPGDQVAQMLEILKQGPPSARVEKLDITEERAGGDLDPFCIR